MKIIVVLLGIIAIAFLCFCVKLIHNLQVEKFLEKVFIALSISYIIIIIVVLGIYLC